MIRAFTGPSLLSEKQKLWVAERIQATRTADTWRSGAAYGVDTVAALVAVSVAADLELYIPAAPHNAALVSQLAPLAAKVVRCPLQSTNAACYRQRNTMMVRGSDQLLAFVWSPDYYRSGEWMAIGIARRLRVPVGLVVLP